MQTDEKKLIILSNEVKDSIKQLPIVTPTLFRSIFQEKAKSNHIEISDEEKLAIDIIDKECAKFTQLQDQAYKNTNILSKNTSNAILAIEQKDDATLKNILVETKLLKEELNKLKETLYKDELTHALNRRWLHDHYINDKENSFLFKGVLSIIDLNYFKQINDTYGHIIGDKVLIFITNELKKLGHYVVRYGGDEFIIIFKDSTTQENASKILSKVREVIVSKKLKANEDTFTVSFSFGITAFDVGDILEKVIENADKNMYDDKIQIKKRIKGI